MVNEQLMRGAAPPSRSQSDRCHRRRCCCDLTGHGAGRGAPDATVVLARTPQGELQVARFASTVWGVQLHPEVDVEILEQWADEDRDRYDEQVLSDVLRRIDAHYDDLVAGWRPLAQASAPTSMSCAAALRCAPCESSAERGRVRAHAPWVQSVQWVQ